MENREIKNKLKNIIEINTDSSKGYRTVAAKMDDDEIKTIFDRLAQQRKLFAEELNTMAIKDLGFEIEASGTIPGYFHRKWIDISSKIIDKSDEDIIKDAIQGEDIALKVYNEIIQSNEMPGYIDDKLKEQRSLIEGSKKQLKSLKVAETV